MRLLGRVRSRLRARLRSRWCSARRRLKLPSLSSTGEACRRRACRVGLTAQWSAQSAVHAGAARRSGAARPPGPVERASRTGAAGLPAVLRSLLALPAGGLRPQLRERLRLLRGPCRSAACLHHTRLRAASARLCTRPLVRSGIMRVASALACAVLLLQGIKQCKVLRSVTQATYASNIASKQRVPVQLAMGAPADQAHRPFTVCV